MTKSTTISYPKNPLALSLGLVLKRKRELMGLISSDIAELVGLGAGYYRLIESGNNNLHISNTFRLTEAFEGRMNLNAISSFISLTYYSEAIAKKAFQDAEKTSAKDKDKLKAYFEGFSGAILGIAKSRKKEKIGLLCNSLIESGFFALFTKKETNTIEFEKELKDSGFVFELEDYLFNYVDYHKPKNQQQDEYLTEFLNDIPSIYLEYLSESKQGLMRLPIQVAFPGLWEWEERSKHKFRDVIGVLDNSSFVTNEYNLKDYKYSYLWEKGFKGKTRFIYFDDEPSREVHERFHLNLKKSLQLDNDIEKLKDFDHKMSLVKFKYCPKDKFDFSEILTTSNKSFNALWIFTLTNKSNVGFAANIGLGPNQNNSKTGISLTYEETKISLSLLEEAWEKL